MARVRESVGRANTIARLTLVPLVLVAVGSLEIHHQLTSSSSPSIIEPDSSGQTCFYGTWSAPKELSHTFAVLKRIKIRGVVSPIALQKILSIFIK
jgi:hypothetical protein